MDVLGLGDVFARRADIVLDNTFGDSGDNWNIVLPALDNSDSSAVDKTAYLPQFRLRMDVDDMRHLFSQRLAVILPWRIGTIYVQDISGNKTQAALYNSGEIEIKFS